MDSNTQSCIFPNIPPEIGNLLFRDDKELIIIGVIGKSNDEECDKMAGLDLIKFLPASQPSKTNGEMQFYFEPNVGKKLYIHFNTPFDFEIMVKMLADRAKTDSTPNETGQNDATMSMSFCSLIRSRFAQILLFATHVCHMIILVETSNVFDTSYLSIFKALKIIREKYVLKFLPKFLKNSSIGSLIGKESRLCSPRFIFYFEKSLYEYTKLDALQKLEFDIEDAIYKMLRNEFIITNNSCNSLFSIPRNKRFVCVNTDPEQRSNPLTDSVNRLASFIKNGRQSSVSYDSSNDSDSEEDIRPFRGFAKPLHRYLNGEAANENNDSYSEKPNRLIALINEHIEEALDSGFDDSIAKFKGKSHFVIPSAKAWYETFKLLHKVFIENPDKEGFEPNDVDYKAYLKNFNKIIDVDDRFFLECCEYGLEVALENYKEMLPHNYGKDYHEQKVFQSLVVLAKYARGAEIEFYEDKLRENCKDIWMSERQQCEYLSLRGNPCILPQHDIINDEEHSSGATIVSTCNCGRTQGRRQDPYTIRQANYEFYQILANSCSACGKLEGIKFPVFEPSINNFRAAELEKTKMSPMRHQTEVNCDEDVTNRFTELSVATQSPTVNLSLGSGLTYSDNVDDKHQKQIVAENEGAGEENMEDDDNDDCTRSNTNPEDVNEFVIKVGAEEEEEPERGICRQPSTTEYLSGMIHTMSPAGLLPQFPSWSLMCIGPSSVYSHNSGLPEHIQSGFLSGANFLLPWDVQVRLENATSWALSYDKPRNRRKPQPMQDNLADGQVFALKIFIGFEYECPRGHRFILNQPDKILRGSSGMVRDGGSKVVFNDMPLYFPCPCRNTKPNVAQLMRVHVVTPKAPVNIILEPKVRTGGKTSYIFITGLPEPPKLTQSAYWILRFPYIYDGNDGPIMPPTDVSVSTSMMYGCVLAGMFGIVEKKGK